MQTICQILTTPASGVRLDNLHIIPERKLRLLRSVARGANQRTEAPALLAKSAEWASHHAVTACVHAPSAAAATTTRRSGWAAAGLSDEELGVLDLQVPHLGHDVH